MEIKFRVPLDILLLYSDVKFREALFCSLQKLSVMLETKSEERVDLLYAELGDASYRMFEVDPSKRVCVTCKSINESVPLLLFERILEGVDEVCRELRSHIKYDALIDFCTLESISEDFLFSRFLGNKEES